MTALDLRIKSDGHPPTLGNIARIQAQTRPDLVAEVFEGRETSYGELERASFGIANALRAAGLVGGTVLQFLLKIAIDFLKFCWVQPSPEWSLDR
jgi:non-ribosomal peptide synthetase component F